MRIEVNGVRLFFDVEGAKLVPDGPIMREKPTLILLHGGPGSDHATYRPIFDSLSDVAQVVYLDHRGNGRSERGARESWTLAQWGDDVYGFCRALEIERPIVLGTSFGGFVALSYAVQHSEHPAKLALVSTALRIRHDRQVAMFGKLGGEEARAAADRFWHDASADTSPDFMRLCRPLYVPGEPDPDRAARSVQRPEVFRHLFGAGGEGHTFDFTADVGRVICPTLVVCGDFDPATPIEDSEDLVAALTGCEVRFERIGGAGHPPFYSHPPTMDIIREFILS